jgi:5-methylcytosine-specific restriction protein B
VSHTIPEWHEILLREALAWREQHPDFRFNLRTGEMAGRERLQHGYWFMGTDRYLFFPPFHPLDPNNKTRTIGFVVAFARAGHPKWCALDVVFGSIRNKSLIPVHQRIITELGPFTTMGQGKHRRRYASVDPLVAFREFLGRDHPRMLQIIREERKEKEFLIPEESFRQKLAKIQGLRDAWGVGRALCLIGTWRGVGSGNADHVNAVIAKRGAWASWWSFPVRPHFQVALRERPFYLYVNAGGKRLPYRMRVDDFVTSPGNEGIESPWPEITDPEDRGRTRMGATKAHVCKTWLRVVAMEELDPPLGISDFEPAEGVRMEALFNQNAFGYAYRTSGVDHPDPQPEPGAKVTNLILYGPPGTGKTYWMTEEFKKYTDQPREADENTWLQELLASYGWRPLIAATLAKLGGRARVPEIREHPWVHAKARQRGRLPSEINQTLWGFLQEHTPETVEVVKSATRRAPFIFAKEDDSTWTLLPDWKEADEVAAELSRLLEAGPQGASTPIRRYRVVTFHPSYSYEDFVRGIRPVMNDDGSTAFRPVDGVFKQICDEARANPGKRYALFIDEINRAHIAKVFGELITLIEPDKRAKYDREGRLVGGMAVHLPGSAGGDVAEPPFGVPVNLDIYGTMNTADRSIALLDVALRRRFEFREMEPDYSVIDRQVSEIHLGRLLGQINNRLEYLLDRDHRIGHAYLTRTQTLGDLQRIFATQVIPLLQEYFFDDFARVALVLRTTRSAPPFVRATRLVYGDLFGSQPRQGLPLERTRYVVTPPGTWTAASFQGIYADGAEEAAVHEVGPDDEAGEPR